MRCVLNLHTCMLVACMERDGKMAYQCHDLLLTFEGLLRRLCCIPRLGRAGASARGRSHVHDTGGEQHRVQRRGCGWYCCGKVP